jgi:hypothetical protein
MPVISMFYGIIVLMYYFSPDTLYLESQILAEDFLSEVHNFAEFLQ